MKQQNPSLNSTFAKNAYMPLDMWQSMKKQHHNPIVRLKKHFTVCSEAINSKLITQYESQQGTKQCILHKVQR